ncbi:MAG: hypothetical protein Ct9H90mP13_12210 [Pseudomonadota bacterium]|nr:MAG: hypothetical protein Ct9H90mP13_12210 [Pseudomonadota bacterium]
MNHNLLTFLIFICFSSSLYAVNDYAILSEKHRRHFEYDFFSDPLNQIPKAMSYLTNSSQLYFLTIQISIVSYISQKEQLRNMKVRKFFYFPIGTALIKTFSYQNNRGGHFYLKHVYSKQRRGDGMR